MTRDTRETESLIEDVISATVAVTGYPVAHVRPFVEATMHYLLRQYGGDRLPKPRRQLPVADILAAVDRGTPMREVRRRYCLGSRTLARLIEERQHLAKSA